ncbi:XYN2-like protein [Mya arenaria]|uniref:XYN2-like protein n=1 Tax=Mya arenaria TaxID=6604 RepID=A0ABY7EGB4_MYAAR|nr:XYN2-like protein [Mya arenaria]
MTQRHLIWTQSWQGPAQHVNLLQGSRYNIRAYVKLINTGSRAWQRFDFFAAYQWSSDWHNTSYLALASHAFGFQKDGWFKLEGDFTTFTRQWHSLRLYIQGPDPGVEYLTDDWSLVEIPENTTWRQDASSRIERIRKSNVTLSVNVAQNFDPQHVSVEVSHVRHEFGFGSLVDDATLLDPDHNTYRNIFREFFNWATVGSYKWKYNRGNRVCANTSELRQNIQRHRRNNQNGVRGHNLFWGTTHNSPDWVYKLTGDQLRTTIDQRINFMMDRVSGKLDHWDVNNELLHGQVYEEMTGDPTYSQHIFRAVHARDPRAKLFLNEYNVVANGATTEEYYQQGLQFKAANCGLYGLGLQSHFQAHEPPDTTLVLRRLEKLAATGLPLWITELTLSNADEQVRADWFENVLTLYFSHPAVEGVILWGFWDRSGTDSDGALVNGNYFHINEAGKRWLDLVKTQWSTNIKTTLTKPFSQIDLRGFHGDYDVIVKYRGKPIKLLHFNLPSNQQHVNWAVEVDGNGDEIVLPTSAPTSEPVVHHHHVTHEHTRTLGHVTSHSGTGHFQCTTRYSALSAVGDDKHADVSCQAGEIMTGCSGRTMDGRSVRDGDYFLYNQNTATCRAVNAFMSSALCVTAVLNFTYMTAETILLSNFNRQGPVLYAGIASTMQFIYMTAINAPVQAVARCCTRASMQCTYMTAGPTIPGKEEAVSVTCPPNTTPTGCTSYTWYGAMDGAYPNGTDCVAQSDGSNPTNNAFVYAACCRAPSMTCTVRKSALSGVRQGDTASVTCPAGETLLGCSVFSEDGKTAGAMLDGSNMFSESGTCTVTNGLDRFPGEDTVTAYAVCCT